MSHKWGPDGKYTFAKSHHHVEFLAKEINDSPPNFSVGFLVFQDGPVAEHGVNGLQNEEVIQVIIERLQALNQPPYAGIENACAITHLQEAKMWLEERTRNRQARSVEGTSTP